jgi:hypothetical protein
VQDIFIEKIDEILKRHLTQKSFELWEGIKENISNKCWEKPTSSSGKYHRKDEQAGRVPSVSEHTYEMIYAADKIISMFEGILNKDIIFLSIALHDSYKYGLVKTCNSTESKHDRIIGDIIKKNIKIFKYALSENDIQLLEESVRFHMGKWSTDTTFKEFSYDKHNPIVLFLSTLDMMSSRNLIKVL